MRKNASKIMKLIFFTFCIVFVPLAIEKIIMFEKINLVNSLSGFSKETWFEFIGSYLGAIGTIILGYITFYQNKKYKELSDRSDEHFMELQKEMKNLVEKSTNLADINLKMLKAKYYPMLANQHYRYINIENLNECFNMDEDVFQITSHNISDVYNLITERDYEKFFKRQNTFTYTLKNEGEKTIRNFCCRNMDINGENWRNIENVGGLIGESCDIKPGGIVRCVYATDYNLEEKILNRQIKSISFKYGMENLLGDYFEMTAEFDFTSIDNDCMNCNGRISDIKMVEKDGFMIDVKK